MSAFSSPLRYPGGKGALTGYVQELMLQNNLIGGEYIEVYAGGAAIAWNLLFSNWVEKVHINDLDIALFSFWHSVLFETEELCKRINDTPVSLEEWERQKKVYASAKDFPSVDLGFSAFFLNRTNRSGILTGGVIGGKKQDGKWTLDVRFNKPDLIGRIYRIAEFAPKISIYNLDAMEFLETKLESIDNKSLIYLDPPYYVKGKGLYKNYYQEDDHAKISDFLKGTNKLWMLSYDSHSQIHSLYKEYAKLEYGLVYTAQNKYCGAEVVFLSKGLLPLDAKNPIDFKFQKEKPIIV